MSPFRLFRNARPMFFILSVLLVNPLMYFREWKLEQFVCGVWILNIYFISGLRRGLKFLRRSSDNRS